MKKDIQRILKTEFNNLSNSGHEVFFISLYGSQRYGLETKNSDYDLRACVLPCINDVLLGKKMISSTKVFEHGEIDLKDIRLLFQNFLKMNINFLEIISDEHIFINPKYAKQYQKLFDMRDRIAQYDLITILSATKGMMHEKYKKLEKISSGNEDIIKKHGYDGKQLSNILRLDFFVKTLVETGDFYKSIVIPEEYRDFLIKIKLNKSYTLGDARFVALNSIEEVSSEINSRRELLIKAGYRPDTKTKQDLELLTIEIMKKSLGLNTQKEKNCLVRQIFAKK